jgi:hypothetical protein
MAGTIFYRLRLLNKDGSSSYSRIITLSRPVDPGFEWVRLHPNPARDRLSVELFSRNTGAAFLRIFNAQGGQLAAYPFNLRAGASSLTIPVQDLPPGVYFLVADAGGRCEVQPFIRKD